MKQLLLLFCFLILIQIPSTYGQCPSGSNVDSDGDGVVDCIDPCISQASSKIGNLSFESNFTGWTIPQNQSFFSINEEPNDVLHGNKSLYITAPNAGVFENHVIYSEAFTLEEGVAYNFTIPVKRIGNVDGDALRWVLIDENGVYRHFNNYYNFTESWSYIELTNFYADFSNYSSNKFRLRLEFGLSTTDMVVDKIKFYESSLMDDPTYADYNSDGIPDCGNINVSTHPDYNALVATYNALNGLNWVNNTNWLDTTKPLSSWYGITETNGRVTGIELPNNNLTGVVSHIVDGLSELQRLNFRSNSITGTITEDLGNLTKLTFLDLAYNFLSGNIPIQLANLQALNWLDLANNQLSGNVPNALTSLPNLTRLGLSTNNFSGTLPDFTNQNLFVFTFDNNYFQFGDFENEFTSYQNNVTQLIYTPQKTIGEYTEFSAEIGSTQTLNTNVSGSQNTYNWYRVNADGSDGGFLTNSSELNITINNTDDYKWFYYYNANSTLVPGLEIWSNYFKISEVPTSSPDYNALVALYNSTNGDNWNNNTNWLDTTKPLSSWYGIQIKDNRVTTLSLSRNNLIGTIPTSLETLSHLEEIDVSRNNINGELPDFGQLNNINKLLVFNNDFSFLDLETNYTSNKSIAEFNYQNQNLKDSAIIIDGVIGNNYSLSITEVLGTNVQYQWYKKRKSYYTNTDDVIVDANSKDYTINTLTESDMDLYTCKVTSASIPDLIIERNTINIKGEISQLQKDALIAIYNSTNGDNWTNNTNWLSNEPISTWYGVTTNGNKITELNFENNNLTGTLPTEIGNLTGLEWLSFYLGNNISGPLPESIGNLTELRLLSFEDNNFTGEIPNSYSNLTKLSGFWLWNNKLSGNVPEFLTTFNNLVFLDISFNQFSGTLPDFTTLPNLNWLNISSNYFNPNDFIQQFEAYKNLQYSWNNFSYYSPQYTMDEAEEVSTSIGNSITLTITDTPSTSKSNTSKSIYAANTYQWFKDNILISGATASSYTINNAQISDSGIYHCEITNPDIPDLTIKRQPITLNVGTLNIDKNDTNKIKIYPNPVKNVLKIKLNNTQAEHATLMDITGKQILNLKLQSEITVIDINNLNAGMYLLQIKNQEKIITKRIIKE